LLSQFWIGWLESGIRLSSPLVLTATGGTISERSGVFNIGMEGMMLSGAFAGVAVSFHTGSYLLATVAAALAGVLFALMLGFLTISRRADQVIAGLFLNLLALGLTNFLSRSILGTGGPRRVAGFPRVAVPLLSDIPVLGRALFDQPVSVYFAYTLPLVAAWTLLRTTWGLDVRAVGEQPDAAAAGGIPVRAVRYAAVAISGCLAGLGGASLALGGVRFFSSNMTAGRGYIALAAIVLGRWNPAFVALACLLFGAADALQLRAQAAGIGIPTEFFAMLPYVLAVAALVGLVGRTRAPAKLGVPYARE
jgi:ABC-type uncharacterized transport system permease subunit